METDFITINSVQIKSNAVGSVMFRYRLDLRQGYVSRQRLKPPPPPKKKTAKFILAAVRTSNPTPPPPPPNEHLSFL
jgi:hypothetical protein